MEARKFRDSFAFYTRAAQVEKVMKKFSGERIPCFVSRRDDSIAPITKSKFLVDRNLSISQFTAVVRNQLDALPPTDAVFILLEKDNTMPQGTHRLSYYYHTHKDEDGFLYFIFTAEATFGGERLSLGIDFSKRKSQLY